MLILAPVPWRYRVIQHLAHRVPVQAEDPGGFPNAHPLHHAGPANRRVHFHCKHPSHLPKTDTQPYGRRWTVRFPAAIMSLFSEKVLANWPAEISHSHHGECDFDPLRTDPTSGSQQSAGRTGDFGPGGYTHGIEPATYKALTGVVPPERSSCPGPRSPGPQASQYYTRSNQEQGAASGWYDLPGSQSYSPLGVAQ